MKPLRSRFADEDEERAVVRVVAQPALDERAQPVDAFAHVRRLGSQGDPDAPRQFEHQPRSKGATTRANARSSKSWPTLSMCSLRRSTVTGSRRRPPGTRSARPFSTCDSKLALHRARRAPRPPPVAVCHRPSDGDTIAEEGYDVRTPI